MHSAANVWPDRDCAERLLQGSTLALGPSPTLPLPPHARAMAAAAKKAAGRIVLTHSSHVPGLIPVLRKVLNSEHVAVRTFVPARRTVTRKHRPLMDIRVTTPTNTGFKLLCRSGTNVQEVGVCILCFSGRGEGGLRAFQAWGRAPARGCTRQTPLCLCLCLSVSRSFVLIASLYVPPFAQVFAITDSSKEDLQNVVDFYLGKLNGTGKTLSSPSS